MVAQLSSSSEVFESLTENQRAVFALIAKRRSAKQIARELEISTSRVSQYVRILKDRFGVENLSDLADIAFELQKDAPPCNKFTWEENHLPESLGSAHNASRPDPRVFHFADAGPSSFDQDRWLIEEDHRIGPEALDGDRATESRLLYMLAVAIGLPIAVIVALTAMATLSDTLSVG